METEEEQVENLKKWLKENSVAIVAGLVIGVGGLFGYRGWMDHQEITAQQASSHYAQMIEALETNRTESVMKHAQVLIDEHSSSDYAALAQMALAKQFLASEELTKAEQALQQVVGSVGDNVLGYLARTRLAALQMQSESYDSALSTLMAKFPSEYQAIAAELRGDIFSRQGEKLKARESYLNALKSNPGPANAGFLQQKLDDLGLTG